MKHVKQAYGECVLATFAMLAGVTIEHAREKAGEAAVKLGIPWNGDWWNVFGNYLRYDTKAFGRETANLLGLDGAKFTFTTREVPSGEDMRGGLEVPDLTGRGQLSVSFGYASHSMAYENGLVHDPNASNPSGETWTEYLARMHPIGFVVSRIE